MWFSLSQFWFLAGINNQHIGIVDFISVENQNSRRNPRSEKQVG